MKKIKHASKEEKLKAVKAVKSGESVASIAKIFKQKRQTIYNWIRRYDEGNSLERTEGSGRVSLISKNIADELIAILLKPASIYNFETDLWNSQRIQIILKKEFGVKASRMSIWRTLKKLGFTYKKVQKLYAEVDREKQASDIKTMVKEIKKTVKECRGILYFADEATIQLSPVMGKTWAPKSEKVFHKVTANKGSVAAISAISNDGRLIFNLFENTKRFKSDDIIDFFTKMLQHHPRRNLVVVMDRAAVHRSKKTLEFIESKKRLHVFHLPPRSPEFNPDEQVWGHLKNHSLKSHQETTVKGLKKLTHKKLSSLSKDKKKLMGIFKRCDNSFLYT